MVQVGVPWNRQPQSVEENAFPYFTVQQAVLVGMPEEDEVDGRLRPVALLLSSSLSPPTRKRTWSRNVQLRKRWSGQPTYLVLHAVSSVSLSQSAGTCSSRAQSRL